MFHVLIGLAGAMATLVVYSILTERLPVISLRRRQLDSWACLLALGWLGGIAYGGAVVQSRPLEDDGSNDAVRHREMRPPPVLRLTPPALQRPGDPVRLVVNRPDPTPHLAAQPPVPAPSSGAGFESDEDPNASDTETTVLEAMPGLALVPAPTEVPRLGVATLNALRAAPTADRSPVIATRAPAALPTIVLLPTHPPTPSPFPTPRPPAPAPTAVCGDPKAIRLEVRFDDAAADNDGRGLAVRYHLRVLNDSAFPVHLAEAVLAALSRGPGAEQFGSQRLDEVILAANSVYDLDGTLTLDRRPSPMTRTDLCMSFVPESCGQREPYRVFRRCTAVHGF